jgi:hypothetical protein
VGDWSDRAGSPAAHAYRRPRTDERSSIHSEANKETAKIETGAGLIAILCALLHYRF